MKKMTYHKSKLIFRRHSNAWRVSPYLVSEKKNPIESNLGGVFFLC